MADMKARTVELTLDKQRLLDSIDKKLGAAEAARIDFYGTVFSPEQFAQRVTELGEQSRLVPMETEEASRSVEMPPLPETLFELE